MSFLARSVARTRVPLSAQSAISKRSIHIDNVVGDNMPFKYEKKSGYGAKLAVYLISGFSIPFVAAWFQMRKSAAA